MAPYQVAFDRGKRWRNSIFRALRDNTDGAQDRFLSEIIRIMEKYPWCDGIDIDLSVGDGYSTHTGVHGNVPQHLQYGESL